MSTRRKHLMLLTVIGMLAGLSMGAAAEDKIIIFDDNPAAGFYCSGWKGTIFEIVNSPTYNNSAQALCTRISPGVEKSPGVNFYTKKPASYIDISACQEAGGSLQFYVNVLENTGQELLIRLINANVTEPELQVTLSDYVQLDKDPATWQKVSIPLKNLCGKPYTQFSGISCRLPGFPSKPVYLDDIMITKEKPKEEPKE